MRTLATLLFGMVFGMVVASAFWLWFYSVVPAGGGSSGSTPVAMAEKIEVGPAGLALPVAGVKPEQLTDTFTQARAGGARRHDAIDIMAPEGTPVIAAGDGTVEKLFTSAAGGITIYERSADRNWVFYYAHLSAYAPGLHEGQQVKRGQVIGRVGHTGDANPAGPHLHFAINRMAAGERWWNGIPVNPYPLLAGKRAGG